MSSNLKVNSLVPATGTEIGIGTTGGSIDFRCPATFGGNVTIGGTLTYDEVINIDSIGVITARSNIDCNGSLDVDGHTNLDNVSVAGVTTFANNISLGDNDRIIFGDGGLSDAHVRYDGSHLQFGVASGSYRVSADTASFVNYAGTQTLATINSTGLSIPLNLDVDGHTNLDNVSITGVTTLSHTGTNQLIIKDSDTTGDDSRMRISFRDAGNTEKFFVGNNTTNGWLYLGSPSGQNNNIAFRVNGNDKFQVNGSGAYVNGALTVSGNADIADSIIHTGDTNTKIRFPAADTISFETGGYERFRITSTGHFGFNTNNPDTNFRMDLAGSLRVGTGSYGSRIQFSRSGLGDELVIGVDGYGNSNANDAMIQSSINTPRPLLFGTNNAERLRIDSSGRVGVNQSSFATSDTMFSVSETSGHCEIGIISKNDSGVVINMGDTDSYNQGRIKYDNSDNSLTFRTSATDRFRIKSDGSLRTYTDANGVSCFSNNEHGNVDFNHRGGRVLHSNGTGWGSPDGQDPILVLAVENRAGNSDIGNAYGLCLHSESQDNNDYGPMIGWSNKSNSGSYNTTYAAVVGKKTGQGPDSNWSAGELLFYTMPTGGYIDNTPNMSIDSSGRVKTPRQVSFYATANSGGTVSMTSAHTLTNWRLSTSGKTYSIGGHFNTSNGRFTAPVDGKYLFTGSILLSGYDQASGIHVSWRKNGNVYQYWYNTRTSDIDRSGYGGYLAQGSTTTFSLSANDYVDVNISFNGSLSLWCGDANWGHFSGHLLG